MQINRYSESDRHLPTPGNYVGVLKTAHAHILGISQLAHNIFPPRSCVTCVICDLHYKYSQ